MEEDQEFYDGVEDSDDFFHDVSLARAKTRPAKVTNATLPTGLKVAVVVSLIFGAVTGLYVAGGANIFGKEPGSIAQTDLPDGHPDISQMGASDSSSVGTVEGLAELVALVKSEPENLEAKLDLGVAYFNAEMYEEAGREWSEVLAQDPDNIPALYSMGFYYLSLPVPDEAAAETSWQRVVDLDPESVEAANATAHLQSLIQEGKTK